MPKIPKPDGHREPRYTKQQYWKLRFKGQGRNQDGTLTAARMAELRAASVVPIDAADADNHRVTCPSCGLCFMPDAQVLKDAQGRLHHMRHLQEDSN